MCALCAIPQYAYFDRDNVGLPGFAKFFKVRALWHTFTKASKLSHAHAL